MCLKNEEKVEVPYDTVGFKVTIWKKYGTNNYSPPFGIGYYTMGVWKEAEPVPAYGEPLEYGWHAYLSYTDALRALKEHQRRIPWFTYRLVLVDLHDVIITGQDRSFSGLNDINCVIARSMYVLRELEVLDVR